MANTIQTFKICSRSRCILQTICDFIPKDDWALCCFLGLESCRSEHSCSPVSVWRRKYCWWKNWEQDCASASSHRNQTCLSKLWKHYESTLIMDPFQSLVFSGIRFDGFLRTLKYLFSCPLLHTCFIIICLQQSFSVFFYFKGRMKFIHSRVIWFLILRSTKDGLFSPIFVILTACTTGAAC